jgi:hypothetical protein
MNRPTLRAFAAAAAFFCSIRSAALDVSVVDVTRYPTLQAAIDANPGRQIRLPAGEFRIDRALVISSDSTELIGPARIVQTNPKEALIRVRGARAVRISDVSFSRAEGMQEAEQHGVMVNDSQDVRLLALRVTDNHSHSAICVTNSTDVTVQGCVVINYKGLAIDDRTNSKLMGYAFKAMDGTGIQFRAVQRGFIRDNRIHEYRMLPTPEIRDRHDLGALTVKPKERAPLVPEEIFATGRTNNWHQGSGIHVAHPDRGSHLVISGNFIENPGQGIDIHSDNVTVANNVITKALIGMKAMHGSKHVLIDGNQFSYCDLWGVMLMPGAASHASSNGGDTADGKPATENVDGGTIVSNNIFSFFGMGQNRWNWPNRQPRGEGENVIAILGGQLESNPPLRTVLITGNVVYDSGADTVLRDGQWTKVPPLFRFALYVEPTKHPAPLNIRAVGNLFDSGYEGVTNFAEAK